MSRFGIGKKDRLPGYFDRDEDWLPPGPQPGEGCEQCTHNERDGFGPPHKPSSNCESGKKPHCTCDACF